MSKTTSYQSNQKLSTEQESKNQDSIPQSVKNRLFIDALLKEQQPIDFVGSKKSWDECFLTYGDFYTFWYNLPSGTTGMVKERKSS